MAFITTYSQLVTFAREALAAYPEQERHIRDIVTLARDNIAEGDDEYTEVTLAIRDLNRIIA